MQKGRKFNESNGRDMITSQTKRVTEAMSGEENDMVSKESMKPRQRTSRSPHPQQELAAAPPQSFLFP